MNVTPTPGVGADTVACAVCGRRFDTRDRLVDHLEGSHSVISTAVRRHTFPARDDDRDARGETS